MSPKAVASLAGLTLLIFSGAARGQACCAGSAAVSTARLGIHDDALVGLQHRTTLLMGSFDQRGNYRSSPSRTTELGNEVDFLAAIRLLPRAQLSLLIPWVTTWRRAGGRSELGTGVGDINVGGRYDITLAGQSTRWPGLSLLAGLTLPTGTPPDGARHLLATDATGIGAWQGNVGVALEQTFGRVLVGLNGLVARRSARRIHDVREQLGWQLTAFAYCTYSFDNDAVLGGSLTYNYEHLATINGTSLPASGRTQTTVGLVGLWPFSDAWRLQGSIFGTPPVAQTSRSQSAVVGFTLALIRIWS